MINKTSKKRAIILFAITLIIVAVLWLIGVSKTNSYNQAVHEQTLSGGELFSQDDAASSDVCLSCSVRGSTWTKLIDPNGEGFTEDNYEAHTFDVTVQNNTKDDVASFTFKVTFSKKVYLSSAWNGSLEIHQHVRGDEVVETVPDLREFAAVDYALDTVEVEGEDVVAMWPGDYFIYYPSSSINAEEIPIKPAEATTPGIIIYTAIGDTFDGSMLEMEYTLHREYSSEPLCIAAHISMIIWLIGLANHIITLLRIKRYQERHERDNELINESIETFTGFIDAKDTYTNGHSKRVAYYTKLIAKEFEYKGEELDHIYYIALLHDCGKIAVPDAVLNKPGKLTDEEFAIIKSHTVRGGEILKSFKSLKDAGLGALYHHERYDGKGYPEGKAGEEIPFIARMICVADSFDAMNSNRVYRKLLSKEKILYEIESNKGRQFDPKIADVMLRLLRDGTIKMND